MADDTAYGTLCGLVESGHDESVLLGAEYPQGGGVDVLLHGSDPHRLLTIVHGPGGEGILRVATIDESNNCGVLESREPEDWIKWALAKAKP